ncbi:MAG: AAA family ATPase [Actinomycetota bacterium]|nr:AAA family ATPase [Actinomycetota bacterium]
MIACPSCSTENADEARFCSSCGAQLDGAAPPTREERKVVTVLFADLVGFTARAERLDPEDVRGLLAPYYSHLRHELERFGGTVEKFIGDAVMALFGAPVAHEDDPERAVRAALAIRDWVIEQGDELQVRIAVNTGEALVSLGARLSEGEGMAAGDVVNATARLQTAAPVNGILVGESTYRATSQAIDYGEAEPVEAKGKAEPIAVWEPLGARSRFGVDLAEASAPLVGRQGELGSLRDALERARTQRSAQLATLVGVPGIGKSRLVHELFQSVDADPDLTHWRQGRSLPYGEGVSYWALAEMVKAQAGILESDTPKQAEAKLRAAVEEVVADAAEVDWMTGRLRSLLGLGDDDVAADGQVSESFAAWRRFLEAVADRRPLVLVFEDLHWADDGLLDFIDQLVDWATGVPLLVLGTARPELLERRPGWGGGKPNALTLSLPPLDDEETARLLSALLERTLLPAETQSALLSRAGGNPLYAEQYARMLVESGSEDLPVPENVQGIIAARLDGLSGAEKALLQDAAVVGKVFWLGAVSSIGGMARWDAEEALHGLERKEFVQRARQSSVGGDDEYSFRHLLVRDVAYGQIPRAARADKHREAAGWIEALGRPDEHAEMLAHHYLSALEYARAAGREDADLTKRARLALRDAGERAASLAAWTAAMRFYNAALELWPEGDPELPLLRFHCGRVRVNAEGTGIELVEESVEELYAAGDVDSAATAAVVASRALWSRGESDRANAHLARALELVADRPESPAKAAALAARAAQHIFSGEAVEAIDLANEALPIAERLGLHAVQARLLELRGLARVTEGDTGGFADFDRSIALATARAVHQLHTAFNNLLNTHVWLGNLDKADETLAALEQNAERHGTASERQWARGMAADIHFIAGRWDAATRITDELIPEVEASGGHYVEAASRGVRAEMRLATGDLRGASVDTEKALELARRAKDAQVLAPALAMRASVLFAEGRADEARALVGEIVAFGARFVFVGNDHRIVETAWLVREAGRGKEYAAATATAQSPWAVAAAAICTDDLVRAADVLDELGYRPGEAYARLRAAEELVGAGRRAEANAQLSPALAFYREVGATRYVREAEALLAESA